MERLRNAPGLRLSLVSILVVGPALAWASIGPDVITADLYQTKHWGAAEGIDAYSVGTISCNTGDEPLLWHSWDNQRPVIAQNMFRLKDGHFEQLGQSWCKWAFASLNQDFCGVCQDPGSGSLLGVNCSDPYSASLNGTQSGLGPKSVINPFLGDFPASHATPGTGTIEGRVQVATEDVDPDLNEDALYFVEGQYVSPDDAAAGNLHNNASYRQVWVQSNLDLTFNNPDGGTSQTVRTKPAIFAWREFDPAVALTTIDVPGEGRFLLAWKASLSSGVQRDIEIAIQNLNSDRALGAFTVLLPAGTQVTEAGFHDVDYHSGEPFDGTDWEVTVTDGSIRWATESYDVNPNANALRWGTLYNFRFSANVTASQLGLVQFELFKPGTPESFYVPLPELSSNDNCSNAFPVLGGADVLFETVDATSDGPSEFDCPYFDGANDADIWYRYEAECDGDLTVSVCGSDFDTKLAVYGAACPAGPGEVLACDNDSCDLQSELTLSVVAGSEYLIRIGGVDGAVGMGALSLSCTPSTSLVNDDCADALPVVDGLTEFDSTGATTDGPAEPGCEFFTGVNDADIWYAYTSACTGNVTVSLCGSAYDTTLAVYADMCPTEPGQALACDNDSCDLQSEVLFAATAGEVYYLRIGGVDGATGPGLLDITCAGTGGLCPGNSIEQPVSVGGLPFVHSGDTSYCTDLYDEECPYAGSDSPDAVYEYVASRYQVMQVDLCASDYDTKLYVYENEVTPGSPHACNDDGCPGSPPESYRSVLEEVPLMAGNTYYIIIDGWGGESGQYAIDMQDVTPRTPGDLNCDGLVSLADINPFVAAFSSPEAWQAAYPTCNLMNADINDDGVVDFLDINPFVALLTP